MSYNIYYAELFFCIPMERRTSMNGYRIIVISDTHGSFQAIHNIVQKHLEEATCFIHLGDGFREIEDIKALYPELKLYAVRGNCDFGVDTPAVRQVVVGDTQILCTHGHLQSVKYSFSQLIQTAKSTNSQIALYGHTHQGNTFYEDGIYIMNPGSPVQPRNSKASYGVIDITDAGIVCHLILY